MQPGTVGPTSDTATASRSRLYQLLALAFEFPDEELYAAIQDGTFVATIRQACAGLPYDLSGAISPALAGVAAPYVDFESEYIRLFDVGAAGPPCTLYGGVHMGDRMKAMEDAVRFYNYFGLRTDPAVRELPDHIVTEIEFMHYLTFCEADLRGRGLDPSSCLRAERDFLERHLCKWTPRMLARLAKQETLPFFPALARLAVAAFDADRAYAAAAAARFE